MGSKTNVANCVNKKDLGTYGEAVVIAEVLKNGCAAFPEFGDNCKIDLIILDRVNKLHSVQIKTVNRSKQSPNSSILYLYKSGPNYSFDYTKDMFDWFAVLDVKTGKLAWISSKECLKANKSAITLYHGKRRKTGHHFDDYVKFPFTGS